MTGSDQAPHKVDRPVTNSNESDDDLPLYSQHDAGGNGVDNHDHEMIEDGVRDDELIDELDYESTSRHLRDASLISKLKGWFKPKFSTYNSYEMLSSTDHEETTPSTGSETQSGDETQINDLRDYKVNLLYTKVKRAIYTGVGVILSMILLAYIMREQRDKAKAFEHKIEKPQLSNSTHEFNPTTLVVSLDGFHPHYISPRLTPTLHNLMINDYGAPYMIPAFPSSTFPNHWTMVTGLYPSEHGIVGNTFYDPKLRKQFVNTNPKQGGLDPDFWQGGEPIWKTAWKNGVKSAIHMWPGSEVKGVGIGVAEEVDKYNGTELLSAKVDRIMHWLDREEINERPELIMAYVPTIDQYGHKYGISGPHLKEALEYVDNFINLLLKLLKTRNLEEIVNLIIVSDHGMAPTSNQRLVYLDDLVDMNKIEHIDGWPLFGLRPYKNYNVDDIFNEMNRNLNRVDESLRDHYRLLKKQDVPKEWHFGGEKEDHKFNYRLAPLWIIPDVGYSVTTKKQMEQNHNDYKPKGVHGYNNTELLMRALFLGKGPYFSSKLEGLDKNVKVKPFANVEVYNIICDTLNIRPAPNNGSSSEASFSTLMSELNILPSDWQDQLEYPNLPFETEILVEGATYDLLWKKPNRDKPTTISFSTNKEPSRSMLEDEKSLSSFKPEKMPKPSDLTESQQQSQTSGKNTFGDVLKEIGDSMNELGHEIADKLDEAIEQAEEWLEGESGHDQGGEQKIE